MPRGDVLAIRRSTWTSIVEAADTPPFFHNNLTDYARSASVRLLYRGPSSTTPRAPAARFNFDQTQRAQLANFMRALNTLQNIDVAIRELMEIVQQQEGQSAALRPTIGCRRRSKRPRIRLMCSREVQSSRGPGDSQLTLGAQPDRAGTATATTRSQRRSLAQQAIVEAARGPRNTSRS